MKIPLNSAMTHNSRTAIMNAPKVMTKYLSHLKTRLTRMMTKKKWKLIKVKIQMDLQARTNQLLPMPILSLLSPFQVVSQPFRQACPWRKSAVENQRTTCFWKHENKKMRQLCKLDWIMRVVVASGLTFSISLALARAPSCEVTFPECLVAGGNPRSKTKKKFRKERMNSSSTHYIKPSRFTTQNWMSSLKRKWAGNRKTRRDTQNKDKPVVWLPWWCLQHRHHLVQWLVIYSPRRRSRQMLRPSTLLWNHWRYHCKPMSHSSSP